MRKRHLGKQQATPNPEIRGVQGSGFHLDDRIIG
jgi:hypothetical protein